MKQMTLITKYLFLLLGLAIFIVGLVAGYVANQWIPIPLGIMIVGGLIFLIGFFAATRKFWQKRSTQTGINAVVATVAFVTIIGSLNILAARYGVNIDLTENQLYSLAPQSQQLVKQLEKPLRVVIFKNLSSNQPISIENQRILENYQQHSPHFSFDIVDPKTKPATAKEFSVQSYGEVYVEYGDEHQFVQNLSDTQVISEVKLSNAIETVQRDREFWVYFLQGHGEPALEQGRRSFSQAAATLKNQGYQVQPLNLAQQRELSHQQDSVLVIASPRGNLLADEIDAIEEYVEKGGHLLLLLGFRSEGGLEDILTPWGIELDNGIILDKRGGQFGLSTVIVNRYGDHPITKTFENGNSLFPLSRPVEIEEQSGIKVTELAYTNEEQTWLQEDITEEQPQYDPDRAASFVLGYALETTEASQDNRNDQSNSEAANPAISDDARVVIFGSSGFAINNFFGRQLNGDFFLNAIDWLLQPEDSSLKLRPKEPTDRRIHFNNTEITILSNVAIIVVPLLGLMMAFVTWLRRR